MDTKSTVVKSIAMCFIGLLFVFVLTWIVFDFQKSSDSLKDTWSIVSALFGGFTTLLAAYIANQLFNDWKVQHNKQVTNNFGLQVYEIFFGFENTLSVYHQYLDELQELITSSDCEVKITTLHVNEQKAYITNITNITSTMSKLIISFYSLYSKFQAYSIVNGTYDKDRIRYDEYLDTFKDISMFDDEFFFIQENLNTWYEMYDEMLALTNKIREFEIEKLLISLKAE